MPATKPSPHRFIAPNPPPTQTPKPKSKSNLRHTISAHTPKQSSELQFKKITPAKRFVVVPPQRPQPGDVISHAPDCVEEPTPDTLLSHTPRPKVQRNLEKAESIEEASQSSPSQQTNGTVFDVVHTIEHDPTFAEEKDEEAGDDDDEILFVSEARSKRRRTSPSSSALHQQQLPETPLSSTTSHRFRLPPPQTPMLFSNLNVVASNISTTAVTTCAPPPSRPHFILPPQPTSPQKPSKPLPEIFSPSRKNQKYVPDGLASTVQTWVIETANTGFAAQERSVGMVWGKEKQDGVRLKVRISSLGVEGLHELECFSGSAVVVRGDTEPGLYSMSRSLSTVNEEEGAKILLAGQGGARGTGGVKIRIGCIIGIRAPTWNIDIIGEKWVVGVDWMLL